MNWDWNNSIDLSAYSSQYEPQGELVQDFQNQASSSKDFSVPLPGTVHGLLSQSPALIQNTTSANAPTPLSAPPKLMQNPTGQMSMKRKVDSEPSSAVSQTFSSEVHQGPTKRVNKSRSSSSASANSPALLTPSQGATANDNRRTSLPHTAGAMAASESGIQSSSSSGTDFQRKKEQGKGTGPQGRVIDVSKPRRIVETPSGSDILPAGKVFPIQIGSELFRLSGASLSSDAPSYFSHFFCDQLKNSSGRAGDMKTLYIDRDPGTFRDIALHLQGYHVIPRDGEHYVRLYADAQFYSLPRLTKQLFSTDIFIRIGDTPFQIPRDLFSAPGDSPNYFSLGFAQFFSTPSEVFPGLDRSSLLRPPSISPPQVPNRSGETFAELIRMLQGYNVDIRNEAHRSQLLRDARYFHLKGLEQRLIPCDISFNLNRGQSEIVLRLEDIRQSGVSVTPDAGLNKSGSESSSMKSTPAVSSGSGISNPTNSAFAGLDSQQRTGLVSYARPFTDDHSSTNILVLEIADVEHTTLHFPASAQMIPSALAPLSLDLRVSFHGTTLARITSLFSVIASKMGLPATQPLGLMMLQSGGGVAAQPISPANSGVSERRVRARLGSDTYIEIDGSPVEVGVDPTTGRMGIRHLNQRPTKRTKIAGRNQGYAGGADNEWVWGGPPTNDSYFEDHGEGEEWVIKKAHWRLRVEPDEAEVGKMQVILCGVRMEGYSMERSRNRARGFLSS
ncbi:hypothetical protein BU24DRAFT_436347 [Aaosphaeria arxii CBS 175.79]|uniref:Potassium channel tetramerisation-type BTB domain-containing protein n=1 Tax=Aaosphaeria arxii CBS 175.79 TaxID=1450172 RepID=A0A6A5XD29_9PLEO|nr:uncharacterized protein BU24DRAFT_436347 [Aaosphaeria arxii CBS 175.79]KAF2011025.1 hypothetical protein BU24DRAFT_436347 [Aaosphaeria arxii CBS 175.79]